jgi:23S rRNA (adenine2503-C2)-methyltransferase
LQAKVNDETKCIMPINETNSLEVLKSHSVFMGKRNTVRMNLLYLKTLTMVRKTQRSWQTLQSDSCKVNIIEYNPIGDMSFNKPPMKIDKFCKPFGRQKYCVNIRRAGKDIDAACGQLANKMKT